MVVARQFHALSATMKLVMIPRRMIIGSVMNADGCTAKLVSMGWLWIGFTKAIISFVYCVFVQCSIQNGSRYQHRLILQLCELQMV